MRRSVSKHRLYPIQLSRLGIYLYFLFCGAVFDQSAKALLSGKARLLLAILFAVGGILTGYPLLLGFYRKLTDRRSDMLYYFGTVSRLVSGWGFGIFLLLIRLGCLSFLLPGIGLLYFCGMLAEQLQAEEILLICFGTGILLLLCGILLCLRAWLALSVSAFCYAAGCGFFGAVSQSIRISRSACWKGILFLPGIRLFLPLLMRRDADSTRVFAPRDRGWTQRG